MGDSLYVIVPVHNEASALAQVVEEWSHTLDHVTFSDYTLLILDDGSKDDSSLVLHRLAKQRTNIRVIRKAHSGHGQTCVLGYREAIKAGASWVFQIDSDGQCDPRYFAEFWRIRTEHTAIFGYRRRREDGIARWLVSRLVSAIILLKTGVWLKDANVPYRLMRASALERILEKIPPDFYLANILVSVLLRKSGSIQWVNIGFRKRIGGIPSARWLQLMRSGRALLSQLRGLTA